MLTKFRRPGSKIWHCRGTHLGVAIRQSTKTGEAKQAEAIIGRWQREIEDQKIHGKKAAITFAEAAVIYMEDGGEGRFLDRILDHFGPKTLCNDIGLSEVMKARKAIYPDAAESTIRRQLETPIKAVLRVAYAEDRADPPFLRARRRKMKPGQTVDQWRKRWLTPEEFDHFLSVIDGDIAGFRAEAAQADQVFAGDPGDYARSQAMISKARAKRKMRDLLKLRSMIGFLIGSGCRPIEMFELDAVVFFPNTREAYIAKSKTGVDRKVKWPRRAAELIASSPLSEEGAVWRTYRGQPYIERENRGGQIADIFNRMRDKAGFDKDVSPYTLRHTWATWYYAATKDLLFLMERGGWKKSEMAQRYTKMAPEDLAARLVAHGWTFADQSDLTPHSFLERTKK